MGQNEEKPSIEYINPATEEGQEYIQNLISPTLETDVEKYDHQLKPEEDGYMESEPGAGNMLACAIEGPCEVNEDARMFSSPEEDFELKKVAYHEEQLETLINRRLVYRAEDVEDLISSAKEEVLKDLKYHLGHQMLMNLLGGPKPKTQEQFGIEELLAECEPMIETLGKVPVGKPLTDF